MNPLVSSTKFIDDFFRESPLGYFIRPLHGDPLPSPDQIKVDVKECGNDFIVKADLPGVRKEDINVSIDGNAVTISAEMKQLDQDKDADTDRILRSERYFGAISRTFTLPVAVDQANAKAKCENGVLRLTLPKMANNASKRLTVE
jgi:HSP20 family protein